MRKIGKAYNYFFFAVYRLMETAPSRWWSEAKAALIISSLEIYLFAALCFYIESISYVPLFTTITAIVSGIIICAFNSYLFLYNNRWQSTIEMFVDMPRNRKILYDGICVLVTLLILSSLIFALYQMSIVDWESIRNAPH